MTSFNKNKINFNRNSQSNQNKKSGDSGKEPNQRPPQLPPKRKKAPNLLLWLLIFLISAVIYHFAISRTENQAVQQASYSEFIHHLHLDEPGIPAEMQEVLFIEKNVEYKIDNTIYKTYLPATDASLIERIQGKGVKISAEPRRTAWGEILLSWLPFLIIIVFWFVLMRSMQGGGASKAFTFGKSRAKMLSKATQKITFGDVAGLDEAKEELQEVVEFLRNPKKFQRLGAKIPRGVLLVGSPGTGKTYLAKAVAGEANVAFFSISGSDFVELFVGVGASRVRDLFNQGKANAPCIIFIDEIDAVGRSRGAGIGGGHDEREQTLNQLLVELDGFTTNEGVIIMAATNRPDVLDPALLRPGRFDRQIIVDKPDVKGREQILRIHTKKIPLSRSVNLDTVAKATPGFSGADIANLANEAALLAARRNRNRVEMDDFEDAKDKIVMGLERRSMVISEEEKRNTAFHEAGHVLMSKFLPGSNQVHKVTIIPRGRSLGATHYLPIDEKHSYSYDFCINTICQALGGRAADMLIGGQPTTGASNDIQRATELARKMVCEWGMSKKLGPIMWHDEHNEVFLGKDFAKRGDHSESTSSQIDREIMTIINQAYNKSKQILSQNKDILIALADRLMEKETLSIEEIDKIIDITKAQRSSGTDNKRPSTNHSEKRSDKPTAINKKPTPTGEKKATRPQTNSSVAIAKKNKKERTTTNPRYKRKKPAPTPK